MVTMGKANTPLNFLAHVSTLSDGIHIYGEHSRGHLEVEGAKPKQVFPAVYSTPSDQCPYNKDHFGRGEAVPPSLLAVIDGEELAPDFVSQASGQQVRVPAEHFAPT